MCGGDLECGRFSLEGLSPPNRPVRCRRSSPIDDMIFHAVQRLHATRRCIHAPLTSTTRPSKTLSSQVLSREDRSFAGSGLTGRFDPQKFRSSFTWRGYLSNVQSHGSSLYAPAWSSRTSSVEQNGNSRDDFEPTRPFRIIPNVHSILVRSCSG